MRAFLAFSFFAAQTFAAKQAVLTWESAAVSSGGYVDPGLSVGTKLATLT